MCSYAVERIGLAYDLKNIIDLMRYLMPLPVPQRWRRRMMALGSGDPTRHICSALIAQAFEAVRYPILPKVTRVESRSARREILEIRHSSLYAPRDFDISPYFAVVKPTIEKGFDYKRLHWADLPRHAAAASIAERGVTLVLPTPAGALAPAESQRPPLVAPCYASYGGYRRQFAEAGHARRRHQSARARCCRRRFVGCCCDRSDWRCC